MRETAVEKKQERRHEVAELADTEAWLEQRLNEQSRTVPVMGRDFEFRPMGTTTVADIVSQVGDGQEDIPLSEMPDLLRKICDLLGEHCTDSALNAEQFGKMPPEVVEGVFMDIAMPEDDGISSEEREKIEQFRNE